MKVYPTTLINVYKPNFKGDSKKSPSIQGIDTVQFKKDVKPAASENFAGKISTKRTWRDKVSDFFKPELKYGTLSDSDMDQLIWSRLSY